MSESLIEKSRFESKKIERVLLVVPAAIEMALSAGVVSCILYLVFVLASLLLARPSASTFSWPWR